MTNFKNNVTVIIRSENIFKITAEIHDLSVYDLVVIPKSQVVKKENLSLSLKTILFFTVIHANFCF